jgi:hypothetical protein
MINATVIDYFPREASKWLNRLFPRDIHCNGIVNPQTMLKLIPRQVIKEKIVSFTK